MPYFYNMLHLLFYYYITQKPGTKVCLCSYNCTYTNIVRAFE